MTIRVVFLTRSLEQGGTERQLATLIPRLNKDRFEVTVITLYKGGRFEAKLTENDIQVINLNKRGRWDLLVLWRLLVELRKIRPAILHSYLVEPNLIAILIKPLMNGTRVVWGIRASAVDLSNYDWFTRLNFRFQTVFSRFADLAIFNSSAGRDYHLGLGFKARRTVVIYPGVDLEEFKPDRESRTLVRKQWAQDEKTTLIGLIGRLDPIKDHATFLRSAAVVASERSECAFVCVGEGRGEYADGLRRLGDELGLSDRLSWAGSCADMPAVYNALDVVCCSSLTEGLPNVVAEAMACNLPCVVTNVGDSALLVGDTGIVVTAHDSQALTDGLKACIDNLQRVGRESPRERIMNGFDVRRLVARTEVELLALASDTSQTELMPG